MEESDGELLCRLAARDQAAFEELYRRFARPVFGLALRRLRDRGRAEDAVQEVFVAIWRSAGSYRPERGPGARWLWRVARNVVIDTGRKSMRHRHELGGELPELVSAEPAPEQAAQDGWISFRVHAALLELPERERVLLELAYWGGQSQTEIARQLGLPLGTVKTRTRSGLARLGSRLEEEL